MLLLDSSYLLIKIQLYSDTTKNCFHVLYFRRRMVKPILLKLEIKGEPDGEKIIRSSLLYPLTHPPRVSMCSNLSRRYIIIWNTTIGLILQCLTAIIILHCQVIYLAYLILCWISLYEYVGLVASVTFVKLNESLKPCISVTVIKFKLQIFKFISNIRYVYFIIFRIT